MPDDQVSCPGRAQAHRVPRRAAAGSPRCARCHAPLPRLVEADDSPSRVRSAAEVIARAADLCCRSAELVHDSERRRRVFRERTEQTVPPLGADAASTEGLERVVGSAGRAALRRAHCPVAVAPPSTPDEEAPS